MILITTSHRPTQKMRTLIKDLNRVLPNTLRTNRGKLSMKGLAENALECGADRVMVVERHQGNPGSLIFYKITSNKLKQVPPLIYLNEIKTQDELGERLSIKRDLIITTANDPSKEIEKLASGLSETLGFPYIKEADTLKFQAALKVAPSQKYEAKISFAMLPTVKEIGPILIVKHVSYQADNNGKTDS
jgi:rRNA maturation protein Rpf1